MFRHKPVIKVISVKNETRDVVEVINSSYGYFGQNTSKEKTKKCSFTIVLLSKDGELCTREFNGKWDISDIKKWENL